MKLRNGTKGQFFGCTGYPACRKTLQPAPKDSGSSRPTAGAAAPTSRQQTTESTELTTGQTTPETLIRSPFDGQPKKAEESAEYLAGVAQKIGELRARLGYKLGTDYAKFLQAKGIASKDCYSPAALRALEVEADPLAGASNAPEALGMRALKAADAIQEGLLLGAITDAIFKPACAKCGVDSKEWKNAGAVNVLALARTLGLQEGGA